jgi:hypothetical protein
MAFKEQLSINLNISVNGHLRIILGYYFWVKEVVFFYTSLTIVIFDNRICQKAIMGDHKSADHKSHQKCFGSIQMTSKKKKIKKLINHTV